MCIEWFLQTVPFGPLTEKNASCVISKKNGLFIIMVSAATNMHFRQSMEETEAFNFKLKEMKSFEHTEERVVEPQRRWSNKEWRKLLYEQCTSCLIFKGHW
jgi:hypothetical protein